MDMILMPVIFVIANAAQAINPNYPNTIEMQLCDERVCEALTEVPSWRNCHSPQNMRYEHMAVAQFRPVLGAQEAGVYWYHASCAFEENDYSFTDRIGLRMRWEF